MLHNLDEEEQVKGILTVLDHNLNVVIKINEAISRLTEKRVTLEEKMIRIYFHKFAASLVRCGACFHDLLAEAYGDSSTRHEQKTQMIVERATVLLSHANRLDELLRASELIIDDLIKILRYDLNFLEQYYEYGFYNKLTNECDFLNRSQDLLESIATSIQSDIA